MLAKLILVFLASALILSGTMYLFRPQRVFKFNAVMRDMFFNDAFVSLNRRRIGGFLLTGGLLTLLSLLLAM
ncbi:MAG: hypothetical protein AABZ44_03975 [Elusimicrobiota bacterium]